MSRLERPQGRAAPSPPPVGVEKTWGGPAFSQERPQGRAAPSPPPVGVEKTWGGPAFSQERKRSSQGSQRGFTLLDVLIAMLVFSLGMLGLSAMYVRAAAQPFGNAHAAESQLAAQALLAVVRTNPTMLPLQLNQVSAASSLSDPALAAWFTQYAQALPGLQVSLVSQADANGTPCSSSSCGVRLTLSWLQGSSRRQQVFDGQIGLR